jgi:hypothetical protein
MRKIVFVSLLVMLAVLLSACGGSSMDMKEGSSVPSSGTSSSTGNVTIVVASNPSPAVVGDVELLLTVTDQSGAPIEGAKVNVNAEHPAMAGMGMSGQAVEQGGGKYSIKANFSNSGDWVLTVSVNKEGVDYKEEIKFKIQ